MCLPAGSKTARTVGCWEPRRPTGKSNDNCCLWSRPGQYIVLELGGIPRGHSKGNIHSTVSYKINFFKVLFWDMDKWHKSGDSCEINFNSVIELRRTVPKKKYVIFFFQGVYSADFMPPMCVLVFRTCLESPNKHCENNGTRKFLLSYKWHTVTLQTHIDIFQYLSPFYASSKCVRIMAHVWDQGLSTVGFLRLACIRVVWIYSSTLYTQVCQQSDT